MGLIDKSSTTELSDHTVVADDVLWDHVLNIGKMVIGREKIFGIIGYRLDFLRQVSYNLV